MNKKENTKNEYFKSSAKNTFALTDDYNEIAFNQISIAENRLSSYFLASSVLISHKTFVIKGNKILSIDFNFVRDNNTACFQISNPFNGCYGTRIWTKSEIGSSIWSTPKLLLTCPEPELLFRFFMKDWEWFEKYIAYQKDIPKAVDFEVVPFDEILTPSSIVGKYFGLSGSGDLPF